MKCCLTCAAGSPRWQELYFSHATTNDWIFYRVLPPQTRKKLTRKTIIWILCSDLCQKPALAEVIFEKNSTSKSEHHRNIQFRTGLLYTTLYLRRSLKYTLLYWGKNISVFSTHSYRRVAHFFTFFTAVMHELQGSQAVGSKIKNPGCFVQCGQMFSHSDQSAIQSSSEPFCSIHCSFCLNKASNKYRKTPYSWDYTFTIWMVQGLDCS